MHLYHCFKGRGTVSGLNIWNMNSTTFTLIMNKSQKCNTGELGDLVSWKAFELASNDNVFKQAPSECDGTYFHYLFPFAMLHYLIYLLYIRGVINPYNYRC